MDPYGFGTARQAPSGGFDFPPATRQRMATPQPPPPAPMTAVSPYAVPTTAADFATLLHAMGPNAVLHFIDPLAAGARNAFVFGGPSAGQAFVGAWESEALRAPGSCKVAIFYVLDAIVRSSPPEFVDMFAKNLETVFAAAFLETDEALQPKLLKLIRTWGARNQFDALLLQRLQARLDPDYDGPPLEDLPKASSSLMTAPPASLTSSAGVGAAAGMPPPAPLMATTMPGGGGGGGGDDVWARAQLLLDEFFVQMGQPKGTMTLAHVQASAPDLFARLMSQANDEVASARLAPPQPQPPPQQQAMPTVDVLTSILSGVRGPSPSPPPPLPLPSMPMSNMAAADLALSKLTQRALGDTNMALATANVLETRAEAVFAPLEKRLHPPRAGFLLVRSWYVKEDEWTQPPPPGTRRNATQSVALFGGGLNVGAAGAAVAAAELLAQAQAQQQPSQSPSQPQPDAPPPPTPGGSQPQSPQAMSPDEARRHAVPKDDSQPNCALTGEPFDTFWSDEHQSWMFANAVRPDPNGPIYSWRAWQSARR